MLAAPKQLKNPEYSRQFDTTVTVGALGPDTSDWRTNGAVRREGVIGPVRPIVACDQRRVNGLVRSGVRGGAGGRGVSPEGSVKPFSWR